jgi:hypothetical protein
MPAEDIWSEFFNIDLILSELQINSKINDLVEIGCGYGTFTIPAKASGLIYGRAVAGNAYMPIPAGRYRKILALQFIM